MRAGSVERMTRTWKLQEASAFAATIMWCGVLYVGVIQVSAVEGSAGPLGGATDPAPAGSVSLARAPFNPRGADAFISKQTLF